MAVSHLAQSFIIHPFNFNSIIGQILQILIFYQRRVLKSPGYFWFVTSSPFPYLSSRKFELRFKRFKSPNCNLIHAVTREIKDNFSLILFNYSQLQIFPKSALQLPSHLSVH